MSMFSSAARVMPMWGAMPQEVRQQQQRALGVHNPDGLCLSVTDSASLRYGHRNPVRKWVIGWNADMRRDGFTREDMGRVTITQLPRGGWQVLAAGRGVIFRAANDRGLAAFMRGRAGALRRDRALRLLSAMHAKELYAPHPSSGSSIEPDREAADDRAKQRRSRALARFVAVHALPMTGSDDD